MGCFRNAGKVNRLMVSADTNVKEEGTCLEQTIVFGVRPSPKKKGEIPARSAFGNGKRRREKELT